MHVRRFLVAASFVAALIASPALPAAAQAVEVSPQWSGYGTGRVVIDGVRAEVITTVADRRVVPLVTKEHAYAAYRVTVRKGGTVFFSERLSPWRTWWAVGAFNSGRTLRTRASTDGERATRLTAMQLRALRVHVLRSSVSVLRAERTAYYEEYNVEDGVLYGPLGEASEIVLDWTRHHPSARSFSDFDGDLTGDIGYPALPTDVTYRLDGTPQRFAVTARLANGIWLRMVPARVDGDWTGLPAASASSAMGNGMFDWLARRP